MRRRFREAMVRLQMPPVVQNPARLAAASAEAGFGSERTGVSLFLQLGVPFLAYLAAMAWLRGLGGDFWLADQLYAWEGHAWPAHAELLENWLHIGGRRACTLAWWLVLLAWVAAWRRPQWAKWRRPLGYLALSVALSTGLVSWLKSHSGMDCPWDLQRYGGTHAYHGLFAAHFGKSGCFPAGHASAGYAWLALYFFFAAVRPQWRRAGLAVGIGAGLLFGVAQQLRGAHFLSHDLTTALVCWSVALLLHRMFQRGTVAPA